MKNARLNGYEFVSARYEQGEVIVTWRIFAIAAGKEYVTQQECSVDPQDNVEWYFYDDDGSKTWDWQQVNIDEVSQKNGET